MLRSTVLRRACGLVFKTGLKGIHPISGCTKTPRLVAQLCPCRSLCQSTKKKRFKNEPLPEAPLITSEDVDFMEELAREGPENFRGEVLDGGSSELPTAPTFEYDLDLEVLVGEDEDDNEDVDVDFDAVPYIPPIKKITMVPDPSESPNLLVASESKESSNETERGSELMLSEMKQLAAKLGDPMMEEAIEAWARAVAPTPAVGPMPLHELANRSTKIKELVKLGVDFSQIAQRRGDLERLLQLDLENQIKPQIRFLVDCGIKPENLGTIFTSNTCLLWTDKDDIQVRINYLEAKLFTQDMIKHIINRAPFWLTLSTKSLDSRLGFIQRTFKLIGSDVRQVASSFPRVISNGSKKWQNFVITTMLLDREFGFTPWERKELLMKIASHFKPVLLRNSFEYCHHQIGLTHTQLVQHATLLACRVKTLKPRYEFLKFLKRDTFDVSDPLYISPDWLWQGTTEEFCEQAAKSTVQEFDTFLKYSTVM